MSPGFDSSLWVCWMLCFSSRCPHAVFCAPPGCGAACPENTHKIRNDFSSGFPDHLFQVIPDLTGPDRLKKGQITKDQCSVYKKCTVNNSIRMRIRDPELFWPLNPGSGIRDGEKNLDPGFRMNIADHFSESLETVLGLKILKVFDADPGSGSCWPWIRDGKIRIRDKHPRSSTLVNKCVAVVKDESDHS
jgi:hypothetical protein